MRYGTRPSGHNESEMTIANESHDFPRLLAAGIDRNELKQMVSEARVSEVLRLWNHIEPDRFPLRFGGLGWFITWESFKRTSFIEFGSALDAAAGHGWCLELSAPAHSPEAESPAYTASVTFQPGRRSTITNPERIEALLRAVVLATSLAEGNLPVHQESLLGVSLTGLPLTETNPPHTSHPAEDMRVWSRLEPERFENGGHHHTSPKYRGTPCAVLAPVHRGMAVLQYMPALSVMEAVADLGWGFQLHGARVKSGGYLYKCTIALSDGTKTTATYPTAGPACVKAHLAALAHDRGKPECMIPRPTDRFTREVVKIKCSQPCKLRTPYRDDWEWVELNGDFAVFAGDLETLAIDDSAHFTVLDSLPTHEEVEASVAAGLLPAPWP